VIKVPELSLVVLIGVSGSGKSTFAARHFRPTEVLSSDTFRGLVGDDETDQSVTPAAFRALHAVATERLKLGRLTVIDATSVQPGDRQPLIALARAHHVLPVAIALDLPERVCAERNATRSGRDFGPHVIGRQHASLKRSLGQLSREGFRRVFVLRGAAEVDAAELVRERAWSDRTDLTGPFDIIGDVHGCAAELASLLGKLGYRPEPGRGGALAHPAGRMAVFVGDLVDRGPDTPWVLRTVQAMTEAGAALCVGATSRSATAWPKASPSSAPCRSRTGTGPWPSWTACSATTCWTAAGWWWRTPACPRRCTAGPRPRSGRSRCTGRRPARPTSTACRCATPGRRITGAGPWSCTGTPRCPRPSG
jgi:predicted kinase